MKMKELFGSLVFNEAVMAERLPAETYREFLKCIDEERPLSREAADVIAGAMKDWAIEKGVTHYTHWFQPMTGMTAEKHDSFITPAPGGGVTMEFSGKELIKGEPDASSFPSGGLRATFEARGYTNWDPSSYAFIKDGILCIPTAFCSYTGEALDKKTPLLRSMEALDKQALRVLHLLGRTEIHKVFPTVGAEQEYFLIDKKDYDNRKDLKYTGRTLFGARPPKGQELEDHYFGPVKPRVVSYMKELDEELWKLGVLAKTKHNEVAPSQHELAPVFCTANIAADHNQLTMEVMKKVATRHGLVCLLHEKPFAGVNGSGKHNNWSLSTDTGLNLLNPGKEPYNNSQFLLFLCAVITAVDEYQDLLRISVASAGNDHRLGAHEAPPAIISMYLGGELTSILSCIAEGKPYCGTVRNDLETGVHILPKFHKDSTDRNRTSPFAFTGNKFEFRMPGSSLSISEPNLVLNTIVAEALMRFADRLEGTLDMAGTIREIIRETYKEHGRIIYNGNNYSSEWVAEAKRRGLLNLKNTAEAIPYFSAEKNVGLFVRHGIFTEAEIHSREEIFYENYCKELSIEALTMLDMARRNILPAVLRYSSDLAEASARFTNIGLESICAADAAKVGALYSEGIARAEVLDSKLNKAHKHGLSARAAKIYAKEVIPAMEALREIADEAELITEATYWPFPTYGQILFGVI